MQKGMIALQVGKQGLTEKFVDILKKSFKNRELVKVSVLRAYSRDREEIALLAKNACSKLGENFTCKVIGFTIFIRKWRKLRKK
jgi:RNA-binding protein YhbY